MPSDRHRWISDCVGFVLIANIQALRAFAALVVVALHIAGTSSSHGFESVFYTHVEGWGELGVDIFFVISGFIMVYTQTKTPRTPIAFMKSRIRRIVPIYWLLTLLFVACVLAIPEFLRNDSFEGTKYITSFFFLTTVLTENRPTLFVGWTLELEMLFYTFFAISLFAHRQTTQLLLTAGSLLLLVVLVDTNTIVFEFIFGMAIGYAFFRIKSISRAWLWVSAAALFLLSPMVVDYGLGRYIEWGIPASIIVLGVCFMRHIQNKYVLHLGNASYSIYLIQVFTVPAFYKLSSELFSVTVRSTRP